MFALFALFKLGPLWIFWASSISQFRQQLSALAGGPLIWPRTEGRLWPQRCETVWDAEEAALVQEQLSRSAAFLGKGQDRVTKMPVEDLNMFVEFAPQTVWTCESQLCAFWILFYIFGSMPTVTFP